MRMPAAQVSGLHVRESGAPGATAETACWDPVRVERLLER